MNIALLGGAFNPSHLGHLFIAQQVLDFGGIDELWFVPTYQEHHLRGEVASVEDRLAMLKSLTLPRTDICTLEIDHKLDGKTIHLLPYLPKRHTYTFIIGADWLSSFHKWERWQELLNKMSFLVIPRDGFPNEPLYQNMTLLDHRLFMSNNISATKIRERVKQELSIDAFVSPGVAEYIKTHKLYV